MASSSGWSSDLCGGADTIVARATPGGRGALAVIRVSGPETSALALKVCPGLDLNSAWRAHLVTVHDTIGAPLEQAVAVPFLAPRSYTGEDMLEVTVHGAPHLVEAVIDAFVSAGGRRAEPGEFTRRAVANGKLDLVQAEAVGDLIAADTAWQLRLAREQLSGKLSVQFGDLRSDLVGLLAILEASLDFEAQGVVVAREEVVVERDRCLSKLDDLLATAGAGELIRDGARVAILGPPNAGKSTLFNHLCGSEKAIVSPHPGTTRDLLEAELDLGGVRVVIQDTAGLRAGGDAVEAEGRRRALGAAASASAVVLLWAADAPEGSSAPEIPSDLPILRVRSKADLAAGRAPEDGWLPVSCRTGEGVARLLGELTELFGQEVAEFGGEVAIAARHRTALEEARTELVGCDLEHPEVAVEAARWALLRVSEMMGEVPSEEVLDEVFSTFCIGK